MNAIAMKCAVLGLLLSVAVNMSHAKLLREDFVVSINVLVGLCAAKAHVFDCDRY